jgi:hypothetical protein
VVSLYSLSSGAGQYAKNFIQQESTFWRRSLWEREGNHINTSYKLAGDFELWTRFYKYTDLYGVGLPLGGFRTHQNQKIANRINEYIAEAKNTLFHYGVRSYGRVESLLRPMLSAGHRTCPHKLAVNLGIVHEKNSVFILLVVKDGKF